MSPPIGPSTLDPPKRGVLPARGGPARLPSSCLSLDYLSSRESVVWKASGHIAPVRSAETERSFKFRSLPQAVGAARRVLRAWEDHFEPDLFYDLSLCVSELVTNRVRYAASDGGEEIELIVRRGEELVRAEVRERRPDVEMSGSLVETLSLAESPSDWGAFIVDRVADRWGVDHEEGTVVWCEIDLASDGWSRSSSPIGTTLSSV